MAFCVMLIGTTGASVYFFMKRKKGVESQALTFRQMQTIISEEIRNVRELVTVRKNFTSVISFSEDKKIPFLNVHMPGSDRKFLMNYSGTITCGCDLDKIRFSKDEMSNRVRITVPNSQILDMYADVSSFKISYKDTGLLAEDIKIEEQNEFVKADLEVQKQNALQEGILNRANEDVRQMLTAIISKRGLNRSFDVEIIFENQDDIRRLNAP